MRPVRALERRDVAAAAALSADAGWNQTPGDWIKLLKLAPETCFGIECDGQLAATITLLCYGDKLAWLGMVLTHRRCRGRGFARALLQHALEVADKRRIEAIKLDATDQGQPIYEKMGFRVEQIVQRWSGAPAVSVSTASRSAASLPAELAELDRNAFGTDRAALLEILAEESQLSLTSRGFLFHRAGLRASYLGPCVAESAADADLLIRAALPKAEHWYWDILATNKRAERLAAAFGFNVERKLRRMLRGKEQKQDNERIYAIAGFELG